MKNFISPFTFILLAGLSACRQEQYEVDIDTSFQTPVVTPLPDGSRQVDLTMVVTQIGNFYYQDFSYNFRKFQGTVLYDSLTTTLPTAREFIQRSFVVPEPGLYYLTMRVGSVSNGSSSGKTVDIP
ncbi:MAG: hypothetical protein IT261_00770 [Saprospiraceae bacterium]|nr:hypothetical protein [Saprospiraceae bacterium]